MNFTNRLLILTAFIPLPLLAESVTNVGLPIHVSQGIFYFNPATPLFSQQVDLTWHTAPPPPKGLGYYAQYLFAFENKAVGYLGLQWDEKGKKAIFSIWDEADRITALPEGSCKRFGHEGKGASCIIPYTWQMGENHRFSLESKEEKDEGVRWQVTVQNENQPNSTLVGTLLLKNSKGFKGYGKLTPTSYATLEYYGSARLSCEELPELSIKWQGPYANQRAITAKSVKINYPVMARQATGARSSCPNVSAAIPSPRQTLLSAGGKTRQQLQKDTRIAW